MLPDSWLIQASQRITPFIKHTPLFYDSQHQIYLKWENQQVTGSFKVRGAFNKVFTLQPWERARGLVAASAGNHGQGIALAAQKAGTHAIVFASEHAVLSKVEAMRSLGAEVHLVPGGYGEAEQAGLEYAHNSGGTWISPYNDGQVIAGQGTIALEIWGDLPEHAPMTWIVPAGGGGLLAGIGIALENLRSSSAIEQRLIAVQSKASPFLHDIYHHGTQSNSIEMPSLADGLAGPVEKDSLTIPLVRRLVQDFILVSEQDIAQAIATCWSRYGEQIEGSAAVVLAAILTGAVQERPAVLVISGGNIQPELFKKILSENGH
jgi:threonine dehydratase